MPPDTREPDVKVERLSVYQRCIQGCSGGSKELGQFGEVGRPETLRNKKMLELDRLLKYM